jgi:acetyl-CoA/propionyl-CoA carboxylase biotin carboxyl carrier protein
VSAPAPIRKLLVANRGEIALRVFRTCRRLGIACVAVASPEDAGALHTTAADEVVAIAGYLDPAEVVRAAGLSGADAVHPGYGFLAESAAAAAEIAAAGLLWIGPPADVLRAGGDKLEAKRIAAGAGVPVVEAGTPDELGFPLIVKASAGGGGRGMRLVASPAELEPALASARREAGAAFGDETVFCERYLGDARHVEVQLLADAHEQVQALGERECSIQRRHQKLLEESPSPALDAQLRREIAAAAVRFARAIDYRGAGTAEFLVSGREFFFLELNARIQVEHPVTEVLTGRDLVADQLLIAAGGRLEDPGGPGLGHAVEVRLYAEDPRRFTPQVGRIESLRLPDTIRVDAGVAAGDEIGTTYDPLIAKLIAVGDTREQALDRLEDALARTEVRGLVTNLPFLRWLVAHPALRAGETTTGFLTRYPPLSAPPIRTAAAVFRRPFRLNLPPAVAAAPPQPDDPLERRPVGEELGALIAPLPGTVIAVGVVPGDEVQPGQTLVVLEAMKMETPVVSPYRARVGAVHVAAGDAVAAGTLLMELEA